MDFLNVAIVIAFTYGVWRFLIPAFRKPRPRDYTAGYPSSYPVRDARDSSDSLAFWPTYSGSSSDDHDSHCNHDSSDADCCSDSGGCDSGGDSGSD